MQKKQFDYLIGGVSLALSLGAFGGMLLLCRDMAAESALLRAAMAGLAFFAPALIAFIGVRAANGLRKSVKAAFPPALSLFTVLGLLLTFAVGFGGQLLYGLRVEVNAEERSADVETEVERVTEIVTENVDFDIYLLLDCSGSMSGSPFTALKESANAFVDQIPSYINLGIAYFESDINKQMDMTLMDAAGKQEAHKFIDAGVISGGTDFDIALETAHDELLRRSNDSTKVIVMVTDGAQSISASVRQKVIDAGIIVYGIEINALLGNSDLPDLVNDTGGMNVAIDNYADSVLDDLMDAFAAISSEVEKEISKEVEKEVVKERQIETDYMDGMLVYDENGPSVYGVIVRTVSLILLALSVQMLYFGKPRLGGLLSSVPAGALASAALTFAHAMPTVWIAAAVAAVCIYACYLVLESSPAGTGSAPPPPSFGGYPPPPDLGSDAGQGVPLQF